MNKLLIEFLGTLLFTLAVLYSNDPIIIGMTLTLIMYFLGGGDYNPALSALGLLSGGSVTKFLKKAGLQVAGALVATQVATLL